MVKIIFSKIIFTLNELFKFLIKKTYIISDQILAIHVIIRYKQNIINYLQQKKQEQYYYVMENKW